MFIQIVYDMNSLEKKSSMAIIINCKKSIIKIIRLNKLLEAPESEK